MKAGLCLGKPWTVEKQRNLYDEIITWILNNMYEWDITDGSGESYEFAGKNK